MFRSSGWPKARKDVVFQDRLAGGDERWHINGQDDDLVQAGVLAAVLASRLQERRC